jgi:spore coat polysaccharide biosynthesis protein SpsF
MGSSRLPGKVLQDICGFPMLDWVVHRAKRASRVSSVMVATTVEAADDGVVDYCEKHGVPYFRGAALDVLDRYYQAARTVHADVIVRLTADCPLIDASVIDDVVGVFLSRGADFAANRLPPPYRRTFPIGLDVEVVSFNALARAWREAAQSFEREHVLPYLYTVEGRFKVVVIDAPADYGALRWTVDTPEDLAFVRELAGMLNCDREIGWLDILDFIQHHPELEAINAGVQHKWVNDVDHRFNGNSEDRDG